jgi:hypothetical protein
MEDANNNKRQNNTELAEPSKRRTSTGNSKQRNHHQYHKSNLWFNFPTMEQLAKEDGQHPIDLSDINYHLQRGVPQDEARTLSNAKIAYPRVPQKHWPKMRLDGKPGQHLHLTQIPFDAEIDVETGYAKSYQLLLHFERTQQDYSSKEVSKMAATQFQKMGISLGNILEPIAPLCSARGAKPWNGKKLVHLRDPATDGRDLLTGTRVFSLTLDEEIRVPKVAKGYKNLMTNDLLTVTISSPNIHITSQHEILTDIVVTSFCRGGQGILVGRLNRAEQQIDHAPSHGEP